MADPNRKGVADVSACARCSEPAAHRVQVKTATGRVMIDQPLCVKHSAMEQRTGQFGMADVALLPLDAGPEPPAANTAPFPASKVRVVRFYDVQCEACNGSASEELFTDRADAEEVRTAHIAMHRRPIEPDS